MKTAIQLLIMAVLCLSPSLVSAESEKSNQTNESTLLYSAHPSNSGQATFGRDAGEFLKPDGQIDMDAIRRSGYQGSLNTKGFSSTFDSLTQQPILRPLSPVDHPDDIYWDNSISPSIPGVAGEVFAMAVYGNKLIVGGRFHIAGGVVTNSIASWDGSTWRSLGSGVGEVADTYTWVGALAVHDGILIAGGRFTSAGGTIASNIASWDGFIWSPLGSGVNDQVNALTVFYDGKLIVGGSFTMAGESSAGRIASWDGSAWSTLGSGMDADYHANVSVRSLAVYGGNLIAGGWFSRAGGVSANAIASWNGSTWSALGSGLGTDEPNGPAVNDLKVYDGRLMVGGLFKSAGGVNAKNIASWSGSVWASLGSGTSSTVLCLAAYDDKLIAGGTFLLVGGTEVNYIASWDGSTWSPLGSGMASESGNPYVATLVVYQNKLIAGGNFTTADGKRARGIAAYDGTGWSLLNASLNGHVYALAKFNERLVAAGNFTMTGDGSANHIASWDGSEWTSLGAGLNGDVWALSVYNGRLIAGGRFTLAGETSVSNIASWDGSTWSQLGSGLDSTVDALTVYEDRLVAGGWFTSSGEIDAQHVASWDGSAWSALGSGMDGIVLALTTYDGRLVAGGSFTSAGEVSAMNIASWDGSNWSPLGTGTNNYVPSLVGFDGELIAGGAVIIAWDGSTWSDHYEGTGHGNLALTVSEGKLISGGYWGVSLLGSNITSWNGSSWSALGTGTRGLVYAMTEFDGKLIAGGSFIEAGGKVSAYLAAWTKGSATEIREPVNESLPEGFGLRQNFPNPFNLETSLQFSVPKSAEVSLEIINICGQHIITLVDEPLAAGTYQTTWNGKDRFGKTVSSGIYFYRLKSVDFTAARKMILLK